MIILTPKNQRQGITKKVTEKTSHKFSHYSIKKLSQRWKNIKMG